MKKIFSNNRLIALAFLTVFSVAISPAVRANDKTPEVPVQLKFAGMINNQVIYQLVFNGSKEQDDFQIAIRDESGNQVYQENIKGENFSKRFLLFADEFAGNTLQFEITSNKTNKKVIYEVFGDTESVLNATVTKLK